MSELPPEGHPLQKLGACLADWLQEDNFNNAEVYMLEIWSKLTDLEQQLAESESQNGLYQIRHEQITKQLADTDEKYVFKCGEFVRERQRATDAEAKLTERDKLLDECEKELSDIASQTGWFDDLLTKLRDRKNG